MKRIAAILCTVILFTAGSGIESRAEEPSGIAELSIEQLMDIEVTSVSKSPQKLSDAASAIYVITQEDIRRSGHTTIPELLRMVPGMEVAQIDANKWAVASRGFNGRHSGHLLVLIDGRTVYSPVFAGTRWNIQDTLLEDIERIEVVRGPGGTLWGANAVNGVINIITRNAADTIGTLVSAGAGNQEKGFGAVRQGVKLSEDADLRVYAKYFDRGDYVNSDGSDANDKWNALRGGFRSDWKVSGKDSVTIHGDIYALDADQTLISTSLTPPASLTSSDTFHKNGGNLVMLWKRRLSDSSDWQLQANYDKAERKDGVLGESLDTYDIEFQHRFPLGSYNEITWGAGYRRVKDDFRDTFTVSFDPDSRETELFSAFLQDAIAINDSLKLTVGSKFEDNDYTGFEYQPSARLLYRLKEGHSVWGAVSKAVRTPARAHSDIRINVAAASGPPPTVISIFGSHDFKSEEVLAYEIGYRAQPVRELFLDLATFYNVYDNLATNENGTPFFEAQPAPPHLVIPATYGNLMDGKSYGVEAEVKWHAARDWQLIAGYTWLNMDMQIKGNSSDSSAADKVEGTSPKNQFHLRSNLGLPHHMELDTALYYVDKLPYLDIDSYVRLDVRLGWHPIPELELSLAGQNLLDNRHKEFEADDVVAAEVPRSVYGKATYRF